MTTGQRIKALRLAKNPSQQELGALVGVKKAAIHKYESGIVVNLKRATVERPPPAGGAPLYPNPPHPHPGPHRRRPAHLR